VALALIEFDGLARRITLYPPDLALEHLPYVMRYAEVDAVVSDGSFLSGASIGAAQHVICTPALVPRVHASQERLPTEWILLTSGTTGRPKMVLHTLASLAGAIGASESHTEVIWGTFYDIRRYGGLQIYLRAVLTRSSLLLTGPQEPVAKFLQRAGEAGVTHISGTPSHWRRALMSPEADRIAPRYIRLSGEIADQAILNSLRSFYPGAEISHAFATTEAGVAFDVRDALSGFPASVLTGTSGVDLKVDDDGENNILAPEPGYSDTVKVPMITLDKYLATSSIERVDVIKIDIEGAELQALRGASRLLAGDQAPVLFVEVNPRTLAFGDTRAADLIELLRSHGYLVCTVARYGVGTRYPWTNAIAFKPAHEQRWPVLRKHRFQPVLVN
jgi:hypothetical protein